MAKLTQPTPRRADWHAEDVKAAIRKTGVSLFAFAGQHGYSPSAVKMALRRPSPDIQTLVGSHIGVAPQAIWPSRYDEKGEPIDRRRSGHKRDSGHGAAVKRQKQEVA